MVKTWHGGRGRGSSQSRGKGRGRGRGGNKQTNPTDGERKAKVAADNCMTDEDTKAIEYALRTNEAHEEKHELTMGDMESQTELERELSMLMGGMNPEADSVQCSSADYLPVQVIKEPGDICKDRSTKKSATSFDDRVKKEHVTNPEEQVKEPATSSADQAKKSTTTQKCQAQETTSRHNRHNFVQHNDPETERETCIREELKRHDLENLNIDKETYAMERQARSRIEQEFIKRCTMVEEPVQDMEICGDDVHKQDELRRSARRKEQKHVEVNEQIDIEACLWKKREQLTLCQRLTAIRVQQLTKMEVLHREERVLLANLDKDAPNRPIIEERETFRRMKQAALKRIVEAAEKVEKKANEALKVAAARVLEVAAAKAGRETSEQKQRLEAFERARLDEKSPRKEIKVVYDVTDIPLLDDVPNNPVTSASVTSIGVSKVRKMTIRRGSKKEEEKSDNVPSTLTAVNVSEKGIMETKNNPKYKPKESVKVKKYEEKNDENIPENKETANISNTEKKAENTSQPEVKKVETVTRNEEKTYQKKLEKENRKNDNITTENKGNEAVSISKNNEKNIDNVTKKEEQKGNNLSETVTKKDENKAENITENEQDKTKNICEKEKKVDKIINENVTENDKIINENVTENEDKILYEEKRPENEEQKTHNMCENEEKKVGKLKIKNDEKKSEDVSEKDEKLIRNDEKKAVPGKKEEEVEKLIKNEENIAENAPVKKVEQVTETEEKKTEDGCRKVEQVTKNEEKKAGNVPKKVDSTKKVLYTKNVKFISVVGKSPLEKLHRHNPHRNYNDTTNQQYYPPVTASYDTRGGQYSQAIPTQGSLYTNAPQYGSPSLHYTTPHSHLAPGLQLMMPPQPMQPPQTTPTYTIPSPSFPNYRPQWPPAPTYPPYNVPHTQPATYGQVSYGSHTTYTPPAQPNYPSAVRVQTIVTPLHIEPPPPGVDLPQSSPPVTPVDHHEKEREERYRRLVAEYNEPGQSLVSKEEYDTAIRNLRAIERKEWQERCSKDYSGVKDNSPDEDRNSFDQKRRISNETRTSREELDSDREIVARKDFDKDRERDTRKEFDRDREREKEDRITIKNYEMNAFGIGKNTYLKAQQRQSKRDSDRLQKRRELDRTAKRREFDRIAANKTKVDNLKNVVSKEGKIVVTVKNSEANRDESKSDKAKLKMPEYASAAEKVAWKMLEDARKKLDEEKERSTRNRKRLPTPASLTPSPKRRYSSPSLSPSPRQRASSSPSLSPSPPRLKAPTKPIAKYKPFLPAPSYDNQTFSRPQLTTNMDTPCSIPQHSAYYDAPITGQQHLYTSHTSLDSSKWMPLPAVIKISKVAIKSHESRSKGSYRSPDHHPTESQETKHGSSSQELRRVVRSPEIRRLSDSRTLDRSNNDPGRRQVTEKQSRSFEQQKPSKSPERKKRSKSPERRRRSRTPVHRKPERGRRSKSPERRRRSRSSDRRKRSKSQERRSRLKCSGQLIRQKGEERERRSRSKAGRRRSKSPIRKILSRSPDGKTRQRSPKRQRSRSPERRRSRSKDRRERSKQSRSISPGRRRSRSRERMHRKRNSPSRTPRHKTGTEDYSPRKEANERYSPSQPTSDRHSPPRSSSLYYKDRRDTDNSERHRISDTISHKDSSEQAGTSSRYGTKSGHRDDHYDQQSSSRTHVPSDRRRTTSTTSAHNTTEEDLWMESLHGAEVRDTERYQPEVPTKSVPEQKQSSDENLWEMSIQFPEKNVDNSSKLPKSSPTYAHSMEQSKATPYKLPEEPSATIDEIILPGFGRITEDRKNRLINDIADVTEQIRVLENEEKMSVTQADGITRRMTGIPRQGSHFAWMRRRMGNMREKLSRLVEIMAQVTMAERTAKANLATLEQNQIGYEDSPPQTLNTEIRVPSFKDFTEKRRYFKNTYSELKPGERVYLDLERWKKIIKNTISDVMNKRIASHPKGNEGGLYVGNSGIGYMLFHVAQSPHFTELRQELMYHAMDYAKNAVNGMKSSDRRQTSFLLEIPGAWIVDSVILIAKGQRKEALELATTFENTSPYLLTKFNVAGLDELLIGRAGYVCGALFANKWHRKFGVLEAVSEHSIMNICKKLYSSGYKHQGISLKYPYYDSTFLGAAHGLSGILQMMLAVPDFWQEDKKIEQHLKHSVDYVLSCQKKNGNIPSTTEEMKPNHKPVDDEQERVHWCDGAPGVVYLFAKAYLIWRDPKYLEACVQCAEITWQKGLLRKGPGLCHGVGGNGYVFLLLYRLVNDTYLKSKYLHRALMFAEFLLTDEMWRHGRRPDHPYSLFEGISGGVCFLTDMLTPDKAAFPFFDVF